MAATVLRSTGWAGTEGPPVDLAVVGGGIAGLTAAWAAHQRGWSVCVLEASDVAGGKMRSERRDGHLIEWGPNSFLGSATRLWQLIDELGLEDEVVPSLPPGDRFVFHGGRARRLPKGPGSLFSGDFLSPAAKLRLLAEPFAAGAADPDESVFEFARRRLGLDAARYLVAPFVSGVYAGDAEQLGARDAFPQLWQWEHDAGSVTLGALIDGPSQPRAKSKRRGMFSFRDGMGTLPAALVAGLPAGSVRTGATLQALTARENGAVTLTWQQAGEEHRLQARRVVLAQPPHATAQVLPPPLAQAIQPLTEVEMCRVAVVHFGGPAREGPMPAGFGVLMAPSAGLRPLGILMPSSVFPHRAAPGRWLHTAFLGGARDGQALDLDDDALVALALDAQHQAFGHLAPDHPLACDFHAVVRWQQAIPQYRPGHRAAMAVALQAVEQAMPGVTLAGNYLTGVSVQDAAQSGWNAVERLALQESP
jgi:oxygen-dependent protoporphyrinogen oxidase